MFSMVAIVKDKDNRRHLRIGVALQVKFSSIEDLENMINASAIDLSCGGMFIRTNKESEKGRKVEIELPGENSTPVRIRGTVRHIRYIDGQPDGIGIEFNELDDPALRVVEGLLEKTAGQGP